MRISVDLSLEDYKRLHAEDNFASRLILAGTRLSENCGEEARIQLNMDKTEGFCSKCGSVVPNEDVKYSSYCRACGAKFKIVWGVSQIDRGHEYRWIFDEETLEKNDINPHEDNGSEVLFPLGGSNVSCTWFEPLQSDAEVMNFLTKPAVGPDSDDPELVDIAEYYLTCNCDYDSITKEYLDLFGFKEEDLLQYSPDYEAALKLVEELKASGYKGFDNDHPFYGKTKNMRLSELEDLAK